LFFYIILDELKGEIPMKGIFDRRGEVVGWIGEEGTEITVYNIKGNPKAFLKRHSVVTFNKIYLGSFKRGYFRDKNGDAVAFVEGALGEPPVPKVKIDIIPPKAILLPRPSLKEKLPVSPIPRPSWSDMTFDSFLAEGDSKTCL
jgi:hypothetical protein